MRLLDGRDVVASPAEGGSGRGSFLHGDLPALVVSHAPDGRRVAADRVHEPDDDVDDLRLVHVAHPLDKDPTLRDLALLRRGRPAVRDGGPLRRCGTRAPLPFTRDRDCAYQPITKRSVGLRTPRFSSEGVDRTS